MYALHRIFWSWICWFFGYIAFCGSARCPTPTTPTCSDTAGRPEAHHDPIDGCSDATREISDTDGCSDAISYSEAFPKKTGPEIND
ncbi:MAG: hypothetical protein ABIR33_15020 [Pyrinomonadaceae bacterium]